MILKCETCVLYVAKTCNIDTIITIFGGKEGGGRGRRYAHNLWAQCIAGSRNMSKGFNLWGVVFVVFNHNYFFLFLFFFFFCIFIGKTWSLEELHFTRFKTEIKTEGMLLMHFKAPNIYIILKGMIYIFKYLNYI